MLALKELRLQGIGRFTQKQTISFDRFGSLIMVDGENRNTGGSSGSGKSTVFNALEYLFGLNSIPNTILQSRLTEDQMSVEADFDFDGLPLTISRGKKLRIDLNGEVTTGSNALAEEKLDQILAIPRHLFRPMLHKRQGEKGFFLNFTPKETNSFLTDCLGLSNFKKHIDKLDNKLEDLLKRVSTLTTSLEAAKAGLKASLDATDALGQPPVKEVDQDTILALKAKYEASAEKLKRLLKVHQSDLAIAELNRPKLSTHAFDTDLLAKYETELADIRKRIDEVKQKEKDRQNMVKQEISAEKLKLSELMNVALKGEDAKTQAVKLAKEVQKIRENVCFTCEQTWNTESAKKKEAELLANIAKLREVIATAATASTSMVDVRGKIEHLTKEAEPMQPLYLGGLEIDESKIIALHAEEKKLELQHNMKQHQRNKEKTDEYEASRKEMLAKQAVEAGQEQGQADLDRRALEMAAMKFRSYEEARLRYENSFANLNNQARTYKEQAESHSKALESLKLEVELAEELKRAVKSYLSCSFDDALDTISKDATAIIQRIPNMATATISLEGVKENKDGKIKEEINAVISVDGESSVPIKSLSGGERSSVDLAIDMAVIDLIESRTNKGINIFILDEPFNGQDTIGVEMALEVLKSSNTNKKLIVVDHNPVVKEFISDRIVVVRNGEESHIQG